jgi:hypothetical protein
MSRIEDAARELVSWDWLHLLVYHPDSEQVIADARALERALNEPDPVATALAALGEAAVEWDAAPLAETNRVTFALIGAVKAYARARKGEQ